MGKKSSRFKARRFIDLEESDNIPIEDVRFLERHSFIETAKGFLHNGQTYTYERALIKAQNEIAIYTAQMLSENSSFVYQEPTDKQIKESEKARWEDELTDDLFESSNNEVGIIVPNYSRGYFELKD